MALFPRDSALPALERILHCNKNLDTLRHAGRLFGNLCLEHHPHHWDQGIRKLQAIERRRSELGVGWPLLHWVLLFERARLGDTAAANRFKRILSSGGDAFDVPFNYSYYLGSQSTMEARFEVALEEGLACDENVRDIQRVRYDYFREHLKSGGPHMGAPDPRQWPCSSVC